MGHLVVGNVKCTTAPKKNVRMIVQRLNSQFLSNLNFKLIKLMPSKKKIIKLIRPVRGGGFFLFRIICKGVKIKIKD